MNLGLSVKLCDLVNLDHLWIILFIFCEVMWITCAPGLVDHLCTWAFLFIVMQNENLGSKKAKAQTRIRPKRLGPKKRNDYKKKNIKGCITENKKAKAQIRTRLKRLWPKTIVEYKKIIRKRLHSQKIKGQIIGPGPCR